MPGIAKQKPKLYNSHSYEEGWVAGEVALLTGGQDRHYTFGLATSLSQRGMQVHVVGNYHVDKVEFHTSNRITFYDLGGVRPNVSFSAKLLQLMTYYLRLIVYATLHSPKLLHILWNYKAEYFDRTFLMLYLKCLGKKIVLTAHNVNRAKRDSCDSVLNRLTLAMQYRLADQIFVHTEKMKIELVERFGISSERVVVIPFGINNAVPDTDLSASCAKHKLGLSPDQRTMLFFGRIVPYKGLEYLIEAFHRLARSDAHIRLIVAGEPMKGFEGYVDQIRRAIADGGCADRVLCRLEFIPDDETELYFKAADVLVLPYRSIFESGILYLAYRFGLPVIASDVGSFREEITNSKAGLVFESCNAAALAVELNAFFESELYEYATQHRQRIREYYSARHSWEIVGEITKRVYNNLLNTRMRSRAAIPSQEHIEISKRAD